MNIADRIQHLRKSKGMSQEELADKIGVSRQSVSKWESEQSVPDIDKIIMMSDYFEVTTDYLLKGIETKKQAAEKTALSDANLVALAATGLNFLGLVVASVVWSEKQTAWALLTGAVFMVTGCVLWGGGLAFSAYNKEKAKRTFWKFNIWLLTFIPLSLVYNMLFTPFLAPYPVIGGGKIGLIAFPVFWLVYITLCLGVVFLQTKKERNG